MTEHNPEPIDEPTGHDDGAAPAQDGTDWKAEARKWEARARQNNSKAAAQASELGQFKQAMAQALGIEKADDPKQLADNLTAAQREANDARRELAVYRLAARNGANPEALADSASFLRSLDAIDPADTAAISDAITRAVENNPALAAGAPRGAGFGDATAGRTAPVADADSEALRVLGFAG